MFIAISTRSNKAENVPILLLYHTFHEQWQYIQQQGQHETFSEQRSTKYFMQWLKALTGEKK